MSHFVYFLYTPTRDRYYVGETCDLEGRIAQHNNGYYAAASTRGIKDWELFLFIECRSRRQALRLERFIKKMRNRKFYFKLKEDTQLQKVLLDKFL